MEKEEVKDIGIQNKWTLKGNLESKVFKLYQILRKKNRLVRRMNSNKILPVVILEINSFISPLPLPILDLIDLQVKGK